MNDFLPGSETVFKFVPLIYAVFIFIVVFISIALFYHWNRFGKIGSLKFKIMHLVYLIILFFLLLTSAGFFISIK